MLRKLMPSEMSIPVMLKRMKDFDDTTKNKYEDIMSIPKDKYFLAIFTLKKKMNHLKLIQGRWKMSMFHMKDMMMYMGP